MSDESAGDKYANAASAHGAATNAGNHRKANAAHDKVIQALKKMRQAPDRGQECLTSLLDHEDSNVRCWAATHLLPLDESSAVEVLEKLSSRSGHAGFDATIVLQEWRAGRLKIP